MAKIKIHFKGEQYEIEESVLASAVATIKQTLAALSGGVVTPDEPEQPDPVPDPEPDVPAITTLEPGLYTRGAIALAEEGDFTGAAAKKTMTWDDAVDTNIIEVDGTTITGSSFTYFSNIDWQVGVELVVPEGITSIDDSALSGRGSLCGIKLPSSITRLEMSAISCSGLETVVFAPNSNLQFIGREALYQNALKYVTLPSSLSQMEFMTLAGNNELQVTYEGTLAEFEQITKAPGWYAWCGATYVQCSNDRYYLTEYDIAESEDYAPAGENFWLNLYDWETKDWMTDFADVPEGISWLDLQDQFYHVTCGSDAVELHGGGEGWIVYDNGVYVHPYDPISASETYYVTQVAP